MQTLGTLSSRVSPQTLENSDNLQVPELQVDQLLILLQIVCSEPKKFIQKVIVHFSEMWNVCDAIAIVLFLVGVIVRLNPDTQGAHNCPDVLAIRDDPQSI